MRSAIPGDDGPAPLPPIEDVRPMTEIIGRVKRQLRPALAFFRDYFDVLCEATGAGGVGVFLGREELREALNGASLEPNPFLDFPGREYELVASVERTKDFCRLMRQTKEGFRRCCKCDLVASTRAVRTKRSQCYECHAGLTDMMAPIVVHGAYVGVICAGQFFRQGHGPQQFEEVWRRVSDIPGLDRDQLEEAYGRVAALDEAEAGRLLRRIEDAARNIAELWENMVTLVSQEKQLGRVQLYQERDFAEMLLGGGPFSQEEALARARGLGLSHVPNAALSVQLDPAAARTPGAREGCASDRFPDLFDAVHSVRRSLPDALLTSISMGEAVLLLYQPDARNPQLQRLRLKELADRIARAVRDRLGCAALVGVGSAAGSPARLADAYREARRSMWLGDPPAAGRTSETDAAGVLTHLNPIVSRLREAVVVGDGDAAVEALEEALQLIGAIDDGRADWRRALHGRVVEACVEALQAQGVDADALQEVRLRYLQDCPTLRTIEQIAHWTRSHLCTLAGNPRPAACGQDERIIEQACTLIRTEPDGALDRAAVAERFGLSEGHFGRIFRRRAGMPYRRYVLLTRMALAQQALLNTAHPVSDIALEVGYSDTSAFTRAFTKECGVSPRAFREAPFTGKRVALPRPAAGPGPAA